MDSFIDIDIFMTFVLPTLIMLGLSVLIAFVLSFLGEKLAVTRDPKIDDVARLLCGANCGGCGYAGCDAFAVALVEGKAQIGDCSPTSAKAKASIASILGSNAQIGEPTVAIVHCNGGNACSNKCTYQGLGDCRSAELMAGGAKSCDVACLGLGSCHNSCQFSAIRVNGATGVAVVDDKLCTSCGACLTTCPKKIISRIPRSAKVYIACSNTKRGKAVSDICSRGCIACGMCAKACPSKAIDIDNNLAVIDYSLCTQCGECVKVCPKKCIHSRV